MSQGSGIEWTDDTWNPTSGCEHAGSPGCDNCYAATMTKRLEAMGQEKYAGLMGKRHFNGTLRTHDAELEKPLHWRKPRLVFVNSMSDLFHDGVPLEFIDKVFAVMALCPHLTFQVLTKRPERMAKHAAGLSQRIYRVVSAWLDEGEQGFLGRQWDRVHELAGRSASGQVFEITGWRLPLPNVWRGTSVENQAAADERIQHLLRCPAAVRFLSCEPLLGALDPCNVRPPACDPLDCLRGVWHDMGRPYEKSKGRIDWVIAGGESGPKARPSHPNWFRSLRDQCVSAGVPFFFKQWGEWAPDCLCASKKAHQSTPRPEPGRMGVMFRCGKKAAGRELDGRTWEQFPEVVT